MSAGQSARSVKERALTENRPTGLAVRQTRPTHEWPQKTKNKHRAYKRKQAEQTATSTQPNVLRMTRRTALSRLTTCRLMPLSSATASSDRPTAPRSCPPANNTQRTTPTHHTRAKRTGRTVSPPAPRVCPSPAQLTRLRGQRRAAIATERPFPPPPPTNLLLLRNRCSCKTANALTNRRADWNMIDKVSTMATAGGKTAAAVSRRRRPGRPDAGKNRPANRG